MVWISAVHQQLQEYEKKLFGATDSFNPSIPAFPSLDVQPFSFGFPKTDNVSMPVFNDTAATSIFSRPNFEVPPQEFIFGAGQSQNNSTPNKLNSSGDIPMDNSWYTFIIIFLTLQVGCFSKVRFRFSWWSFFNLIFHCKGHDLTVSGWLSFTFSGMLCTVWLMIWFPTL